MSYHQGSVWPLFTGWAAMAEYRGGQPLAGYQILRENANLTKAQDLGAVTELLSGDFYVPFGRSTSHQLWSSAMVITPILRGLFGITIDAQSKTITVNPHLPAGWNEAAIRGLRVPGASFDITFEREGGIMRLDLSPAKEGENWHLRSDVPGSKTDKENQIGMILPLPPVELGNANESQRPGSRTSDFRIVHQESGPNQITITAEGLAGSRADLPVRRHKLVQIRLHAESGLANDADDKHPGVNLTGIDTAFRDPNLPLALNFIFPPGEGWKTITVTLTW